MAAVIAELEPADAGALAQQDARGAALRRVQGALPEATRSSTSSATTTTTSPRPTCPRATPTSRRTPAATRTSSACATAPRARCSSAATWSSWPRCRASTAWARPTHYAAMALPLGGRGRRIEREDLLRRLTQMQYARNNLDFRRGTFRARGDVIEVFPVYEEDARDPHRAVRRRDRGARSRSTRCAARSCASCRASTSTRPATTSTPRERVQQGRRGHRGRARAAPGGAAQARRSCSRPSASSSARATTSSCCARSACATASRTTRAGWTAARPGEPPFTLLNYFPEDWIVFVDESHVSMPQVGGMYRGDRARKETLVEHGFRLPSALDNRPLRFEEWERLVRQVVYVSATPGAFELERSSGRVAEQIVRPTGLLDPLIEVRPARTQVDDLLHEIRRTVQAGWRALVTTLTKRSAEELTTYLRRARRARALPALGDRRHRALGDPARPAPGRVRRARRHQPAARGARPARGGAGGRARRRQGGLPALGDLADPDLRARGAQRRGARDLLRRPRDRLDPRHAGRGRAPPRAADGLQRRARHRAAHDHQADPRQPRGALRDGLRRDRR